MVGRCGIKAFVVFVFGISFGQDTLVHMLKTYTTTYVTIRRGIFGWEGDTQVRTTLDRAGSPGTIRSDSGGSAVDEASGAMFSFLLRGGRREESATKAPPPCA